MIDYSRYSLKKKRVVIITVTIVGVMAQVGVALLALGISGNLS